MRAFSPSALCAVALATTLAILPLWPQRAFAQDELSVAENTLYAATQAKDVPGQLRAIQQIAEHYTKVDRPKRALSYYRLGLETDPTELGKAGLLRQIAEVHLHMSELENARLFVQESIRILRAQARLKANKSADPNPESAFATNIPSEITHHLSASLVTMAHIRIESLDFFQAQEDIGESLRLGRSLKNEALINKSYQALVRLREKQGNVEGTQIVLKEWAQSQKAQGNKEAQMATLALVTNTNALSLCEKNWKENNFAGALKAARSQPSSKTKPLAALELCKAKSLIKLNRHQELLADYNNLPPQHPLVTDPGMQLLVSRSLMGLEQYEKAASVSRSALQRLNTQNAGQPNENTELQFALVENLILIQLQSPPTTQTASSSNNLLMLCDKAGQINTHNNSPIWSECALAHASAGQFDKALTYTQWAELWFAEFGTSKQTIENRLIKALIQVELGEVEDGILSVNQAISQMEKANPQGSNLEPETTIDPKDPFSFERKANEILGLAAEKKGEGDRAANFYKLALNAANAENNELEMERLAIKLAGLAQSKPRPSSQANSPPNTQTETRGGPLSRVLTWFDKLRSPEYLRSLNPFKKKSD